MAGANQHADPQPDAQPFLNQRGLPHHPGLDDHALPHRSGQQVAGRVFAQDSLQDPQQVHAQGLHRTQDALHP